MGSKHTLTSLIFSGGQDPNPSGSTSWVADTPWKQIRRHIRCLVYHADWCLAARIIDV